MLKNRNVGLAIVLTIVTCGLYGIYWFVQLTDAANELSGDHKTSGGTALLLTLITCGIYSFFWSYNIGKKMYNAQVKAGVSANDNSILYLALNFFGLSIVSCAIIQSDINEIVERNHAV